MENQLLLHLERAIRAGKRTQLLCKQVTYGDYVGFVSLSIIKITAPTLVEIIEYNGVEGSVDLQKVISSKIPYQMVIPTGCFIDFLVYLHTGRHTFPSDQSQFVSMLGLGFEIKQLILYAFDPAACIVGDGLLPARVIEGLINITTGMVNERYRSGGSTLSAVPDCSRIDRQNNEICLGDSEDFILIDNVGNTDAEHNETEAEDTPSGISKVVSSDGVSFPDINWSHTNDTETVVTTAPITSRAETTEEMSARQITSNQYHDNNDLYDSTNYKEINSFAKQTKDITSSSTNQGSSCVRDSLDGAETRGLKVNFSFSPSTNSNLSHDTSAISKVFIKGVKDIVSKQVCSACFSATYLDSTMQTISNSLFEVIEVNTIPPKLLKCCLCGVVVHEGCCGQGGGCLNQNETWCCDLCQKKPQLNERRCRFCGFGETIMVNSEKLVIQMEEQFGCWAHSVCNTLNDGTNMVKVDSRRRNNCVYCGGPMEFYLECLYDGCEMRYHPLCCLISGGKVFRGSCNIMPEDMCCVDLATDQGEECRVKEEMESQVTKCKSQMNAVGTDTDETLESIMRPLVRSRNEESDSSEESESSDNLKLCESDTFDSTESNFHFSSSEERTPEEETVGIHDHMISASPNVVSEFRTSRLSFTNTENNVNKTGDDIKKAGGMDQPHGMSFTPADKHSQKSQAKSSLLMEGEMGRNADEAVKISMLCRKRTRQQTDDALSPVGKRQPPSSVPGCSDAMALFLPFCHIHSQIETTELQLTQDPVGNSHFERLSHSVEAMKIELKKRHKRKRQRGRKPNVFGEQGSGHTESEHGEEEEDVDRDRNDALSPFIPQPRLKASQTLNHTVLLATSQDKSVPPIVNSRTKTKILFNGEGPFDIIAVRRSKFTELLTGEVDVGLRLRGYVAFLKTGFKSSYVSPSFESFECSTPPLLARHVILYEKHQELIRKLENLANNRREDGIFSVFKENILFRLSSKVLVISNHKSAFGKLAYDIARGCEKRGIGVTIIIVHDVHDEDDNCNDRGDRTGNILASSPTNNNNNNINSTANTHADSLTSVSSDQNEGDQAEEYKKNVINITDIGMLEGLVGEIETAKHRLRSKLSQQMHDLLVAGIYAATSNIGNFRSYWIMYSSASDKQQSYKYRSRWLGLFKVADADDEDGIRKGFDLGDK